MSEYHKKAMCDLTTNHGDGVRVAVEGGSIHLLEWRACELRGESWLLPVQLARQMAKEILGMTEGHADE